MTSPRPRTGPRPRPVVVVLTVLATALLVAPLAVLVTAPPVAAAKPNGAQVELIFAEDPNYDTALFSGTFNRNIFVLPVGGVLEPPPSVNGCAAGQGVAFAFVPASDDPSAAGSAERPVVTAGLTVEDAFTWPTAGYLGDSVVQSFDPRNLVGKTADQKRLDERWPADTDLSVVAVCYTGSDDDPAQQVLVPGPGGVAITSWLQFSTVASPTNPVKTSAGFAIGVVKTTPVLRLTGAQSSSSATLTAKVSDADGAVIPEATGAVEFQAVHGTDRDPVGTAPLDADGVAELVVGLPDAGVQTVYEAVYRPDSSAATLFNGATSQRYAVVGPEIQVASTMTLTVPDLAYGDKASATVTVRRGTAPASGPVTMTLDGQPLSTLTLAGGRASARLPEALRSGSHVVAAEYTGNTGSGAAKATTTFTIGRLTSTLAVEKVQPATTGSARKKGRAKVTLRVTVTCSSSAVEPTGAIEVRLKGRLLATGALVAAADGVTTLVVKLPKAKSRKGVLVVSYAGTADIGAAPEQSVPVKLPGKRRKPGQE